MLGGSGLIKDGSLSDHRASAGVVVSISVAFNLVQPDYATAWELEKYWVLCLPHAMLEKIRCVFFF